MDLDVGLESKLTMTGTRPRTSYIGVSVVAIGGYLVFSPVENDLELVN